MRTSKKSQLIQAALEIIDKKSLDALTYESLAKASGMSKSGLLYHFPSRTALLLALNEQPGLVMEGKPSRGRGSPSRGTIRPRTPTRRRGSTLAKRDPRRPSFGARYSYARRRRRGVG